MSLLISAILFVLLVWLCLGIMLMVWLFRHPRVATRMVVVFGDPQPIEEVFEMSYQLSLDNKVFIESIQGVDRKGNAAALENVLIVSSDPTVATVEEVEGVTWVIPQAAGLCQIQVSADAKIGEGEKTINGIVDLEVLPGEAVTISVNFGAPVPVE